MKNTLLLAALALAACGGKDIGPIVGSCTTPYGTCTEYGNGTTYTDVLSFCHDGTASTSPCSLENQVGECVANNDRVNYYAPDYTSQSASADCGALQSAGRGSLINPAFGDL